MCSEFAVLPILAKKILYLIPGFDHRKGTFDLEAIHKPRGQLREVSRIVHTEGWGSGVQLKSVHVVYEQNYLKNFGKSNKIWLKFYKI